MAVAVSLSILVNLLIITTVCHTNVCEAADLLKFSLSGPSKVYGERKSNDRNSGHHTRNPLSLNNLLATKNFPAPINSGFDKQVIKSDKTDPSRYGFGNIEQGRSNQQRTSRKRGVTKKKSTFSGQREPEIPNDIKPLTSHENITSQGDINEKSTFLGQQESDKVPFDTKPSASHESDKTAHKTPSQAVRAEYEYDLDVDTPGVNSSMGRHQMTTPHGHESSTSSHEHSKYNNRDESSLKSETNVGGPSSFSCNANVPARHISTDTGTYFHYETPSLCEYNSTDRYVDCSSRNLPNVPNQQQFPREALIYTLKNNSITRVLSCAFSVFHNLTHLDLSNNLIAQLGPYAFDGLHNLEELSLWGNKLKMTPENFPKTIFRHLYWLTKLKINHNNEDIRNGGLEYPHEALSALRSLTELSMDGQYRKKFGQDFQSLTLLTSVSLKGYLSGYCNISTLFNDTFVNVPYIKHLDISSCYVTHISDTAFAALRQLVFLNLNHNEDIDIKQLPNVFHGLQNISTLRHLHMQLIANRYSIGICLDSTYLEYFPQNLETFGAQENNIEGVDRHVIHRLSPTLRKLDVSGNKFVFGTYLRDLPLMRNLTHLRLDGGNFVYSLPGLYPYELSRIKEKTNCTLYEGYEMPFRKDLKFTLLLPPKLKKIEMNNAGLKYMLSKLEVDPNNKLEYLSMAGNNFQRLEGPFYGLHSIQTLNLSSCYVIEISTKFFSQLQSLRKLNLGSNLLGDFFANSSDAVFANLSLLTHLNLTFNDIKVLKANVFSGLHSLKWLMLYHNPLSSFIKEHIFHIPNLHVLSLDNTRIRWLDISVRNHFDNMTAAGKGQIKLEIERCPIMCDCDNLDFLIWMSKSKAVDLGNKFQYQCLYPDTSSKIIKDGYADTLETLRRQCTAHQLLFFFVGAGTCLMLFVIIGAIIYRFRWKIRYLYYAAHLFYRGKGSRGEDTEYEYDAFICYDGEDEEFVVRKLSPELEKRNLKLCIHGRDFIAGDYIASNIVKAVCSSRKTVVVLTRNLVDSYWCGYELQMANLESIHTGRQVLVFLLVEEIPQSVLGVEVLYNIRNNTYIPYPNPLPDATSMGRLWDKLASDIRS